MPPAPGRREAAWACIAPATLHPASPVAGGRPPQQPLDDTDWSVGDRWEEGAERGGETFRGGQAILRQGVGALRVVRLH